MSLETEPVIADFLCTPYPITTTSSSARLSGLSETFIVDLLALTSCGILNFSEKNKIFALKPDEKSLSEVVVIGYGTQRKSATTGAVSHVLEEKTDKADINRSVQSNFGEKEFQAWCQQKANKNICDGKGAAVKVSFFIDETGKPSNIEYKKYSCENAREEIEKLLSSSPVWTEVNRRITMTVKW